MVYRKGHVSQHKKKVVFLSRISLHLRSSPLSLSSCYCFSFFTTYIIQLSSLSFHPMYAYSFFYLSVLCYFVFSCLIPYNYSLSSLLHSIFLLSIRQSFIYIFSYTLSGPHFLFLPTYPIPSYFVSFVLFFLLLFHTIVLTFFSLVRLTYSYFYLVNIPLLFIFSSLRK